MPLNKARKPALSGDAWATHTYTHARTRGSARTRIQQAHTRTHAERAAQRKSHGGDGNEQENRQKEKNRLRSDLILHTRAYTHTNTQNTRQHTDTQTHMLTKTHKTMQQEWGGGRGPTQSVSGLVGVGVGGECRVRVGSRGVGGYVGGRMRGGGGSRDASVNTLSPSLDTVSMVHPMVPLYGVCGGGLL